MTTQLTQNELEILSNVAGSQIEENYSEYTSVGSSKEKGTLGSLVKKGLVFNGYEGYEKEMGYMFYLTEKGFEACKELGISTAHIVLFN
jgi:hypothetical protein